MKAGKVECLIVDRTKKAGVISHTPAFFTMKKIILCEPELASLLRRW